MDIEAKTEVKKLLEGLIKENPGCLFTDYYSADGAYKVIEEVCTHLGIDLDWNVEPDYEPAKYDPDNPIHVIFGKAILDRIGRVALDRENTMCRIEWSQGVKS